MYPRRFALLCSLLCLCSSSTPAGARKLTQRDAQLALPSFTRGVEALKAGDLATATQALTTTYRQAPRPEALLQLARLAVAEHRALDAYDLYHRYLADPTRIPDEQATKEAEQQLKTPPALAGSLTVLDPPGALLVVNSRVVGVVPLPLPLLLSPGEHTLVIEENRHHFDTPVRILAGRHAVVRTGQSSGALLITILPAMLVVEKWTGVPGEAQRAFTDRVEHTALSQQMGVMPASIAGALAPELQACLSTRSCQQQLTQRNQLDYFLYSQIKRSGEGPQAAWEFELALGHTEVAAPASAATVTCAPCSNEQAVARYQQALTQVLVPGLARPAVPVQLNSEPAAAAVTVAGIAGPLGKTPLHLTLWEGSYDLALRLPGYQLAEQRLVVSRGNLEPVTVTLAVDTNPEVLTELRWVRQPRPRWRIIAGGVGLGLAANLLTVGIVAALANGKYCAMPDDFMLVSPANNCQFVYDTSGAVAATVSLGLALGIGGAIVLGVPGKLKQVAVPRQEK